MNPMVNHPLVLVVEDDPDTAALYRTLLTAEGMEVACCGNGQQARQWWQAAARPPDLVVIDVRLPDISGLDLAREMSAPRDESSPAVIVLSAHGDPRMPQMSRQAGAAAFLDKLRDLDRLVETAWRLVRSRGVRA